jgi:hypothetical protein
MQRMRVSIDVAVGRGAGMAVGVTVAIGCRFIIAFNRSVSVHKRARFRRIPFCDAHGSNCS